MNIDEKIIQMFDELEAEIDRLRAENNQLRRALLRRNFSKIAYSNGAEINGNWVKEQLSERHKTVAWLSRETGIPDSTVRSWVYRNVPLKARDFIAIEQAFSRLDISDSIHAVN